MSRGCTCIIFVAFNLVICYWDFFHIICVFVVWILCPLKTNLLIVDEGSNVAVIWFYIETLTLKAQ